MSTNHLQRYKYFLLFLLDKRNNIPQKESVLKYIDNSQLNFLIEIVYNILQGNVSIPPTEYKTVKRYRNLLRKLVENDKTVGYKKKLLIRNRKRIIQILDIVQKSLKKFLS